MSTTLEIPEAFRHVFKSIQIGNTGSVTIAFSSERLLHEVLANGVNMLMQPVYMGAAMSIGTRGR